MEKKRLILFALVLSILLISFVSAVTPQKINTPIEIKIPTNYSSCNITVSYPNTTNIVESEVMTIYSDVEYASYILSSDYTSISGVYTYYSNCGNGEFSVNAVGSTLSTPQSIIYVLVFVFFLLIFAGLLIATIVLPSKNNTDATTGYVIAVSNLKYLKIFCGTFTYLAGMFLFYFSWMLSLSYTEFGFASTILQFIFYGLSFAILPLFIILAFVLIANIVRDSKIGDFLLRGFNVNESGEVV